MEYASPRSNTLALATNKVIRNTYLLLTMTLFTAAITAAIAMANRVGFVNPLLVLVMFIGMPFLIHRIRNSALALPVTFLFTGFMGYILGPILNMYMGLANGPQIVMSAFVTTAVLFLALSGYALTTRRDFNFMGSFLFVGMLVVLGAIILNLFMQLPALSLTISAAAVILMSGMILYDTSRLVNGGENNYIVMTVSMFASIYVLFIHLLNLFAFFSGRD